MGSNFAHDLALLDDMTIERQVAIHLSANHYPPIPKEMVKPCIEAIDAVNDLGLWHLEIPLPEGVLYKGNLTTAPAHAIIDQHHLESWIIEREEY